MSLLLESVRIVDGEWQNIAYHQERMRRSTDELFDKTFCLDFDQIDIPEQYRNGVVKFRVLYDTVVREMGFEHYTPRRIESLKLVYDDRIDYHMKWADRSALNELMKQKGDADEILIVKEGWLTDISYANIVLRIGDRFITPAHCLLKGTRRQQLLDDGLIEDAHLTVDDLKQADSVVIINAMLGLEDKIEIPFSRIIF